MWEKRRLAWFGVSFHERFGRRFPYPETPALSTLHFFFLSVAFISFPSLPPRRASRASSRRQTARQTALYADEKSAHTTLQVMGEMEKDPAWARKRLTAKAEDLGALILSSPLLPLLTVLLQTPSRLSSKAWATSTSPSSTSKPTNLADSSDPLRNLLANSIANHQAIRIAASLLPFT